ncbi:MAG TPA: hypothetical protein VF765_31160 [Polyangiaceae bacterium]
MHQLQHYEWVQLFSSYSNLSGQTTPGTGHRQIGGAESFAYKFVRNESRLPDGYEDGWAEPAPSGSAQLATKAAPLPGVGAPGGAWAFRRESFDAVGGLLDRCILGSGDWFMAFGLASVLSTAAVEAKRGHAFDRYRGEFVQYIHAWQRRAAAAVRGNIGYVDGYAVHHFHGPMVKRGYATRDSILIDHGFSPVHDVFVDSQGVLQLTPSKPALRDAIRRYFLSRSEDLPQPELRT